MATSARTLTLFLFFTYLSFVGYIFGPMATTMYPVCSILNSHGIQSPSPSPIILNYQHSQPIDGGGRFNTRPETPDWITRARHVTYVPRIEILVARFRVDRIKIKIKIDAVPDGNPH